MVDDSEVETPGTCHLELWTTAFLLGDGYGNFAPACTASKMPFLEMGAAYSHCWDTAIGAPLLGPQMKVNIRSAETTNLGLGIALNAAMNLKTGEFALGQIGLRYTPGQGPIGFDLMFGALIDPAGTRSATFGVTLRFS